MHITHRTLCSRFLQEVLIIIWILTKSFHFSSSSLPQVGNFLVTEIRSDEKYLTMDEYVIKN